MPAACLALVAAVSLACGDPPRKPSASAPLAGSDRARLVQLLRAGHIVIASDKGCAEWQVILGPDSMRGALRRDVRERGCVGIEEHAITLTGDIVHTEPMRASGQCSDGYGYVGGSLCMGRDWRVVSSGPDSVTVAVPGTRNRQRWFRDLETCRARPRVALAAGC